jgi:predicted SAM-dependent methyltransferase
MRRLLLFFFSHRTLALIRWDLHFIRVRLNNAITLRKRIKRKLHESNGRYLNLGCGPRGVVGTDWINIDGFRDRNVHICLDLNRALPFPDGLFSGIFAEHLLEHFDQAQGEALLRECFRTLEPGGCVRVIVPDGEKIVRTYLENPAELVARRGNGTTFGMDALNLYFRQRYEHQFMYDWPLLRHHFIRAGFVDVQQVSYKQGNASRQILLDDEKYAWESLYVEAVKPASDSGSV